MRGVGVVGGLGCFLALLNSFILRWGFILFFIFFLFIGGVFFYFVILMS